MIKSLLKVCFLGFLGVVISDTEGYFDCPHWPHLLLLGTQKAATSSLVDALKHIQAQSNICDNYYDKDVEARYFRKEVHFFNKPERFEKGPSFYCSRFSTCESTQVDSPAHLDGTPNYLDFGIASLMNETFPPLAIKEMKIIVVLREPVGRLLSWLNHMRALYAVRGLDHCEKLDYCNRYIRKIRKLSVTNDPNQGIMESRSLFENFVSFEELFEMDKAAVDLGKYVDILEEFFDVFGTENFLVLNYDFLLSNQRLVLTKVADFLNIPDAWSMDYRFDHKNEQIYSAKLEIKDIDCKVVEKMDEYYSSYNRRLYRVLNKSCKSFSSQMPHFGEFEKLPKCSDEVFSKRVLS